MKIKLALVVIICCLRIDSSAQLKYFFEFFGIKEMELGAPMSKILSFNKIEIDKNRKTIKTQLVLPSSVLGQDLLLKFSPNEPYPLIEIRFKVPTYNSSIINADLYTAFGQNTNMYTDHQCYNPAMRWYIRNPEQTIILKSKSLIVKETLDDLEHEFVAVNYKLDLKCDSIKQLKEEDVIDD